MTVAPRIDHYREAFDFLKRSTASTGRFQLIEWAHVEQAARWCATDGGFERIALEYDPGERGWLDHPDWEDWRHPATPPSFRLVRAAGTLTSDSPGSQSC